MLKFKVKPGLFNPFNLSRKHYFSVHVFASQAEMYRKYDQLSIFGPRSDPDYSAITMPLVRRKFDAKGNSKLMPKIGNALFWQGSLGTTAITHESVHIATTYLRVLNELRLDPGNIDDEEEKLAYSVGSVARQIVAQLYEHQLL